MEIKDFVLSFGLSKELAEFGIKQESLFWWTLQWGQYSVQYQSFVKSETELEARGFKANPRYAAFTVSELIKLLPATIKDDGVIYGLRIDILPELCWVYYENGGEVLCTIFHFKDKILQEALGKTLIWAIKEGYVEVK